MTKPSQIKNQYPFIFEIDRCWVFIWLNFVPTPSNYFYISPLKEKEENYLI